MSSFVRETYYREPSPRAVNPDLIPDWAVWVRRVLSVLLIGATVFYIALGVVGGPAPQVLRDVVVYGAGVFACVGFLVFAAIVFEGERWVWGLLALGVGLWAVGDVVRHAVRIGEGSGLLTVAVSPWSVPLYPCLFVGLLLLLAKTVRKAPTTVVVDSLVVALACAAYLVWFVDSAPEAVGGVAEAQLGNTIVPLVSVFLICLLVGIVAFLGYRASNMWLSLLVGGALLGATDLNWFFNSHLHFLFAGNVEATHWVQFLFHVGWLGAFAFLSTAAFRCKRVHPIERGMLATTVPLGVGLVAAFGLILWATWSVLPTLPVVLATLAVVLGFARAAQVLRLDSRLREADRLIYVDSVTGLPNRRDLDDAFVDPLGVSPYYPGMPWCGFVLMDVDGFRAVNDGVGRAGGDVLLKVVADRAMRVLEGSGHFLVRVSGDEFGLLLSRGAFEVDHEGDEDGVWSPIGSELNSRIGFLLGDIQKSVGASPVVLGVKGEPAADMRDVESIEIQPSVSFGVCLIPEHGVDGFEMLKSAELALRSAREERVRFKFYDSGDSGEGRARLEMMQQLRRAMVEHEFTAFYQPQLNLVSGRVESVEALVRWQHPVLGVLGPGRFLDLVEEAGLSAKLTLEMLAMVLRDNRAWFDRGVELVSGVNLSMSDLCDPEFPYLVKSLLSQYEVPAERLTLEVTESVLIESESVIIGVVRKLQDLGVRVSIDDYGIAYSSLSQLNVLKANELKLDRTFVSNIGDDAGRQVIATSTIGLADALGVDFVAEGVEVLEDVRVLEVLGCRRVQGFFVCPPVSSGVLLRWLSEFDRIVESGAVGDEFLLRVSRLQFGDGESVRAGVGAG